LPALLVVAAGVTVYVLALPFLSSPTAAPEPAPPITISSHRLDFGTVPLHGSVVRQLVLRNDGDEPIGVLLSMGQTRLFSTRDKQLTLMPGVASTIPVTLQARESGTLQDQLEIFFDRHAASMVVELEGRADPAVTAQTQRGSTPQRRDSDRARSNDSDIELEGSRSVAREGAGRASADREPVDNSIAGDSYVAASRGRPNTSTNTATGSGTRTQTSQATGGQPEPSKPSNRSGSSRKQAADGGASGERSSGIRSTSRGVGVPQGARAAVVFPYDPATSAPITEMSGAGAEAAAGLEQNEPKPLSENVPDPEPEPEPEQPADEEQGSQDEQEPLDEQDPLDEEDPQDEQDPQDEEDEEEPEPEERLPTLLIEGVSTVSMLGTATTFYPQQIPIAGSNQGGTVSLLNPIMFPTVPLAFGESFLISQTAPTAGQFDAVSGQFEMYVNVVVVDSDGDGAPMQVRLTTGTAVDTNEAGLMVSISGAPRVASSEMLKLVGMKKIPIGFDNGAEDSLVIFEILAHLSFGTPATDTL